MDAIEALAVDQTLGDTFQPGQLWYLGIDIYVAPITIEWLSPGDVWVILGTRDSVGRWQLTSAPGDVFRVSTLVAGTRAWVNG